MIIEPLKVLFTIPNFITAGSGQALLHVVKRLDRERFSPSIAVLKTGGSLEDEIRALGIPLLELPFTVAPRPLSSLPLRVFKAAQLFRPYKFDLFHSYHYGNDYTEPLIARASGAKAWVYTKKNMSWGGSGRRAWNLRTRFATRVAAQNTAMLEQFFIEPQVRRKVVLLPRGVDTEKFRPGVEPILALRQQLGISPETVLVGTVAHLVPVKGIETLIKAVSRVPSVHLVIAGKPIDAAYVQSLEALCVSLGVRERVHFLGGIDQVAALHAEIDMFVLPTLGKGEGCPVSLLESLACGKAAIATDIPGSQDIIEDRVSGILVLPEDALQMAEAIRTLVDSPEKRRAIGEAARQRVLAHYRIEREVQQHEALYAEIFNLPAH